jgi:transketolase
VSTQAGLDWTTTDERAVDLIRVLAMDSVQKAGSGYPGTAMSLAPAAYLLFQRLLRYDPADPQWPGRDRFVLSCGHSSLTALWRLFTGEAGASIGVDRFGASADYKTIYREFGITAERVAAAARDSLARA